MADQSASLSVYLLRPDRVASFEKAMSVATAALPLAAPLDGYAIALPSKAHPPDWAALIQSILQAPSSLSLRAQSPAALVVVRQDGKTFVLSFGHAWSKLEDDWLQPDFGRRIALNLIPPSQLVEIHVEQIFAKWHIARERAPRASSVREFAVQFDRDLVASVEGIPSNTQFGKKIRGSTSLRVEIPFSQLTDLLKESISYFESDSYRKSWPEIDNMKVITDDALVEKLEAQLDDEFKSGQAQKKMVMFTPAYRRADAWSVDSYVYGRMSKSPTTRPYLLVDGWINYLAEVHREPSVKTAKETPIHLMDDAKEAVDKCTAFQCFGYELGLAGRQYILSSGIWYEVSIDFLAKVNKTAGKIEPPNIALPAWDRLESEPAFNLRCGQAAGFLGFDAKNIIFGGGQSKFEFCDVLHMKSRTLFFAKIPSKSSGMSHLFEQVRRTAELLFSADGTYRKELTKVFKQYHKGADTDWLTIRPRHGDWNLCLVSLGKPALKLPFFARCGLVKLYGELREQGHEVSFLAV
jgi:uncharacterized protein (TIGR04141 family)